MSGRDLSCGSSLWGCGKTLALCGALFGLLPSASATESRKVLVLSISEGGRQLDSLRSEIGQLVQRAGGQLIESSSVSSSDRSCEEPSCLRRIVDEQKVDLVLAARIERRPRHERLVDMWIYDAETSRDHASSDLCDARDLKECVGSIAGRLASPLLDPAARSASSQPSSAPLKMETASQPASVPKSALAVSEEKRSHPSRPLPGWRIGLGTVLGIVGVGALATAIATQQFNGRTWAHSDSGERGTLNTMPVFVSGYVVAGLSAAGVGLSLFLPSSSAREEIR